MSTNLAEDLQAENQERETEALVPHADSNGTVLEVGNLVHVSVDLVEETWDFDNNIYAKGRDFDFGSVTALNEDGTVTVLWNGSGCGCNSEGGREENAADLTITTEDAFDVYYVGHDNGFRDGQESNQRAFRNALGLPHPSKENDN